MERNKSIGIILERRRMPDFYGQEEADREMPPVDRRHLRYAGELAGDWEYVRENVYPVLVPAGSRRLDGMVHTLLLDLAVVYAIHMESADGEKMTAWIGKHFLDRHGADRKELHRHALKNLEKDGYDCYYVGELGLETGSSPSGDPRHFH